VSYSYTATVNGSSKDFNSQEDFLDFVESLCKKGVAFTIKVPQKYLPEIYKKITDFFSKAKINLTIESDSDPKLAKILSHAAIGGIVGGTAGSVGGVFIGKMLLKKVAQKTLERTVLIAVPGTQGIVLLLTIADVIYLGSIFGGAVLTGIFGAGLGVAICYWKVTINIEVNNSQNAEIKFQPKSA
jgi:hypothetical protein